MEFVDAVNLETEAKRAPFTPEEVKEGLRQLLETVVYIHGQGVMHRDIKPENIMVQSRNPLHLKLIDFGLASSRSKDLGTFCGTPQYAAPEMVLRTEQYNNTADIWSVGVIALEYLYGFPLYKPALRISY